MRMNVANVVNVNGYICKVNKRKRYKTGRLTNRVRWLVEYDGEAAVVELGRVRVPSHLVGRQIKFKMEVVKTWGGENNEST